MFVLTNTTKNQQTKPGYIYNTITTSEDSIATVNEVAWVETLTDYN